MKMRRDVSASHQNPNRDLEIYETIYAMGVIHLQMEECTMALVLFDESL